jgi:hypothetical protein
VFDPGRHAIATYHGALDPVSGDIPSWVRSVAVSIPGTMATMTNFGDDVATDLYRAAGPSSAVFQWAGGVFPPDLLEATQTSYADVLAPRLRDFSAGIAVPSDATLTMVGHSYGGTTLGLAERAGLDADRIVYVSSAGMGHGVDGVADFPRTNDAAHYSLMARNDALVGLIQGADAGAMHGRSALDAPGVLRLETGFVVAGDPGSGRIEDYDIPTTAVPTPFDAHASVFKNGSTAFENIVAVITGGSVEPYADDRLVMARGRSVPVDTASLPDADPHRTESH